MTAWPIVFNFEPSSQGTPAIDIRQGNSGAYTIKAIPDPKYPNTLPSGPLGAPPTLPPQPTITSISVSRPSGVLDPGMTIWNISGTNANVSLNSNNIFPFKNITLLLEDDTTRQFTTKAEVDNFIATSSQTFLVTSCVPNTTQYVYKALTVTATSNSTTTPTYTRTFWIRMESDFNESQSLLLYLLNKSKPYINKLAANIPPTVAYVPPEDNSSNRAKGTTQSYTSTVDRNELDQPDFSFDKIFRGGNSAEEIAKLEANNNIDIMDLVESRFSNVEVNMATGDINTNRVDISDIELLREQMEEEDCCGCDIPDIE